MPLTLLLNVSTEPEHVAQQVASSRLQAVYTKHVRVYNLLCNTYYIQYCT